MALAQKDALIDLSLTALLSDATDGAARLVTDIAKFGFDLLELHVVRDLQGACELTLRLTAPQSANIENIAARLARHVSVVSLRLA